MQYFPVGGVGGEVHTGNRTEDRNGPCILHTAHELAYTIDIDSILKPGQQ